MARTGNNDLVLGWQVTETLEPRYWLVSGAKAGGHTAGDTVNVEPHSIARHTVVIAQSGSGRLNFLGRFVEELLICTKSNVLIIDSNSDFRNIAHLVAAGHWSLAKYDPVRRAGFLPDEPSQDDFAKKWSAVTKVVYASPGSEGFSSLRPSWCDLPIDWLFADVGRVLQEQLRACHRIMQIAIQLTAQTNSSVRRTDSEFLKFMKDLFSELAAVATNRKVAANTFGKHFAAKGKSNRGEYQIAMERTANYNEFVTKEATNFYFSVANSIQEKGWVTFQVTTPKKLVNKRVEVIDLPSIGDPVLRAIVSNLAISQAWEMARKNWEQALSLGPGKDLRVPTFIVLDDAHHYAVPGSDDPIRIRSLELLRTIAAEGRKYGIFLILVSPRPDALDPLLVSEFENRALMKVGSPAMLKRTADLLGFNAQELAMADRCLEFRPGMVLLTGSWSNTGPVHMFPAPRRTLEGGQALSSSYWARP